MDKSLSPMHNSTHDAHAVPYFRGGISLFSHVHHCRMAAGFYAGRNRRYGSGMLAASASEKGIQSPRLSAVMQSFKSFTARRIIDLLETRAADVLLRQLRAHKLRHKTRSEYQLWQEGSRPKQISSEEMMWQKLEYIHNNPLERGYVDDPLHWRYSSARNYAGQAGLIEVITDWR
jgi:hypothetical protein